MGRIWDTRWEQSILGRSVALLVAGAAVVGSLQACGGSDAAISTGPSSSAPTAGSAPIESASATATSVSLAPDRAGDDQLFPDVVAATASWGGDSWTITATLSSPYDTPERYADAWRVVGPDGTVYGERILTHDHQGEQPFTRSLSDVVIPDDIAEVIIEGRDQVNGYGGATFALALSR